MECLQYREVIISEHEHYQHQIFSFIIKIGIESFLVIISTPY